MPNNRHNWRRHLALTRNIQIVQAKPKKSFTGKSFDICKQDGDLFVSVNVNLVKLDRLEISSGLFLLQGDVPDHLLGHETRQDRQQESLLPLVLLLSLETHFKRASENIRQWLAEKRSRKIVIKLDEFIEKWETCEIT